MNAVQAEPAEIVAELPLRKGPGERLRSARKAKGIDLGHAARDLHLAEDRLAALERDEYSAIPGRVFVRGYLKNYARLVGLPPEQILAAYDTLYPPEQEEIPPMQRVGSAGRLRPEVRSSHGAVRAVTWIIVVGLIALLLTWWKGYLEWPSSSEVAALPPIESNLDVPPTDTVLTIEGDQPPERTTGASAAARPHGTDAPGLPAAPLPIATAPAEPQVASAPAPDVKVVVEFTGTSWAEIRDSTGTFKLSGTFRPGTKRELGGTPPYSVSIGNHKAVVLRADGQPVDLRPHFNGSIVRFNFDPRARAAD
ncbi:MAG: helix-turn-helix domain-containing protein [Gammaproteobacteria bacterium]|nr:helix-turn-helix domain-containing protein [Gammaproteobacteria bacterium]